MDRLPYDRADIEALRQGRVVRHESAEILDDQFGRMRYDVDLFSISTTDVLDIPDDWKTELMEARGAPLWDRDALQEWLTLFGEGKNMLHPHWRLAIRETPLDQKTPRRSDVMKIKLTAEAPFPETERTVLREVENARYLFARAMESFRQKIPLEDIVQDIQETDRRSAGEIIEDYLEDVAPYISTRFRNAEFIRSKLRQSFRRLHPAA